MRFFVAALLCATLGISSADIKPLTVQDNQIFIGGSPGALVGNSLFWTNSGWGGEKFYNAKVVQWLKKDWNSNLVRVAMGVEEGGGYLSDPQNNLARVKAVIEAAIAAEMYVIVDWHSHCANQHQDEAIKFFQEIAKCYGSNTNLIYEIWNEPKDDVSWSANVKPYAVAVIKAIREIDNNNLIVVGSPHWSQDVDAAAADPITGYKNIAYSLHFYAGSHHQELRDKAAAALKKIPLFVTEWGAVNADGNGGVNQDETNKWIEFMKANNLSNANWSLNDKPEGASSLKSGCKSEGEWNDSDLTESGTFVRNMIKQWSPDSASDSASDSGANSGANSGSNSHSNSNIKPLTVQDNQILIGGSPGVLVGNSLFWSNSGWGGEKFYNAKVVQWLKKDWNSNLVRAAMGVEEGGGYLADPQNNLARVKAVIEAAIAAEMYVIVDWHSHCANQHQDEAIKFFQEIAKCYGNNTNLIYEIWNEPKDDVSWSANVKPYAVAVIKAIREIDNNNLIVVGSPHWSQDVDAAAADPITGYKNIAYSLHFYAGSHHQELRDKAAAALKKIPLFVTEWGAVNADGNGGVNQDETNKWIEFMKANNLSNANWSLNDKPEGASSLKSGCKSEGEWNDSDLTESGTFVRNMIKQWSPNSASDSGANSGSNSGSNSYSNSSTTISKNPANTDVCSCCVCNCP